MKCLLRWGLGPLALWGCGGPGAFDVTGPTTGTQSPPVPCVPTVAFPGHSAAVTTVAVDSDDADAAFDVRRYRMRPFEVGGGDALTLSTTGPLEVFESTGEPTDMGQAGAPLLIAATGPGSGSLTVGGPDCEDVTVSVVARPAPRLVGHGLTGPPWFDFVSTFNANETVEIVVGEGEHPGRAGVEFAVYVVPDRTAEEWAADASLEDAIAGPSTTAATGLGWEGAVHAAWDADLVVEPGSLTTGYDVVVDFDGDGSLSPGDLIDGLHGTGLAVIRDLIEPGPYGTIAGTHDPSYWNTMRIYTPDTATPEPGPLVVISHGNGHDYTWYDYLGEHLASWGYVVISHRNDTGPGPVTAAGTTLSNTETFLRDWPTLGLPVTVDGDQIAWIGHSRGGEGVMLATRQLFLGQAAVSEFDYSDIKLVQSIAPTLFEGAENTSTEAVPLHILSGTTDGDVTGGPNFEDLQYYRAFQNGTGTHWVTLVHGADHNDFNCCGFNDSAWVTGNPPVIGRLRAQDVAKSYLLAALEVAIRGNTPLAAYFSRGPELFRPMSANAYIAAQAMTAQSSDKWILDDFQSFNELEMSSSGGAVAFTGGTPAEGPLRDLDGDLAHNPGDPGNGMTWSVGGDLNPERGLVLAWGVGEEVTAAWTIPDAARDMSGWESFTLRAAQTTRHPNTVALDDLLSFSIALTDGQGTTSVIDFAHYGRIPEVYPREGLGAGVGWFNEFQTVRVDLAEFAGNQSGLDLSDIVTAELRFGELHGSGQGRIGLDDLEFLAPGVP